MSEYITPEACKELRDYYIHIIAKTLYLATIVKDNVHRPAAHEPFLIFRTHNNRMSYLAVFRALNLLEEFALTILPTIGLPRKELKYEIYWPCDQVNVKTFTDKPLYDFLQTTILPITSSQSEKAWCMLQNFDRQLYMPLDVRYLFHNQFKVGFHSMIDILEKPYLARERAETLLQKILIQPLQDDSIYYIYKVISHNSQPSRKRTKLNEKVEQFVLAKAERFYSGQGYDDLQGDQLPDEVQEVENLVVQLQDVPLMVERPPEPKDVPCEQPPEPEEYVPETSEHDEDPLPYIPTPKTQ